MIGTRAQIMEAVKALQIVSPMSFTWFGKPSPTVSPRLRRNCTDRTAAAVLRYFVQMSLYRSFYTQGVALPDAAVPKSAHIGVDEFLFELDHANTGEGLWQEGWSIRTEHVGFATVCRDGLTLRAAPGEWRRQSDGAALRMPKGLPAMSPGYYLAIGDTPDTGERADLRIYWNLHSSGAPVFLREVSERLNSLGIAFQAKVLKAPAEFTRCDAAVLYLPRKELDRLPLGEIAVALGPHLKARVPAMTRQVARGCGLAEDPGNGSSFGLDRCGLLADGLIAAHRARETGLEQRMCRIDEAFSRRGLSLETPYLNAGSDEFPVSLPATRNGRSLGASAEHDPDAFAKTAEAIGATICRQAIRSGQLANWTGATAGPRSGGGSSTTALGPNLYGGTAGVALFLAELYAASGETLFRDTALRAIRHARLLSDEIPVDSRASFYTGTIGIAYASAIVAKRTGEEGDQKWHSLIPTGPGSVGATAARDLLGGWAGAIIGLVAMSRLTRSERLLETAMHFGSALIGAADEGDEGQMSWASPDAGDEINLLGLSHGASGIGLALLELWQATDEARFRDAALRAFAYERSWLVRTGGEHWPDLRGLTTVPQGVETALPSAAYWCHGAAGIALARLRAVQLCADRDCAEDARTAIAFTAQTTEDWLDGIHADFSLCHGLAGNADILGTAAASDCEFASAGTLAGRVFRHGLERYRDHPEAWPSGTGRGSTPGLMLGLAGIGHAYLRRAVPEVPPVLCISTDPERFSVDQDRRELSRCVS